MPKLCVIPGDGIGREVVPAAVDLLQLLMPELEVRWAEAGWDCFQTTGEAVPAATLAALAECGAGLFGAVSSPTRPIPGYRSTILQIRQHFNLYANIRPAFSLPAVSPDRNVDMVIFRENSEGLYLGEETLEGDGALATRRITKTASRRLARAAISYMARHGRKRLTIVHKANVLPLSDGLFRDVIREEVEKAAVGGQQIEVDEILVDAAALKMVENPEHFQVVAAPNLYGDILSDIAAYWMGGLGLAPSINLGERMVLAEPVHGSAPDIAGQGIAHPGAAILSAAMLMRWVWQRPESAQRLETAFKNALREWQHRPMATRAFVSRINHHLENQTRPIPK